MIVETINTCEADIKKDLYSNIILCGGNTLFGNIVEEIENKVIEGKIF